MSEFDDWDGTLEGISCPWGGIGNYALLDEYCDWRCPHRTACIKLKKKAQREREGDKWSKLFQLEEVEKK